MANSMQPLVKKPKLDSSVPKNTVRIPPRRVLIHSVPSDPFSDEDLQYPTSDSDSESNSEDSESSTEELIADGTTRLDGGKNPGAVVPVTKRKRGEKGMCCRCHQSLHFL